MNQKILYPLAVAYGFQGNTGAGTTFILPGKEVTIEGADEILPKLLSRCNGYSSAEEIVASVSAGGEYDEGELHQLLITLEEHRIVVDAYEYYQLFHLSSANPMPFLQNVSNEGVARILKEGRSPLISRSIPQTPLETLLESRGSVREFTGEPLFRKELNQLSWATYGRTERSNSFPESSIGLGTVPSGGALYPLRLFAFVLQEAPSLREGIYRFGPGGLKRKECLQKGEIERVFLGYPTPLENAAVVLVLICDFLQTTQKYSNRGYRYALLEAGHAAQNAYLWCTEQGLGVVEIGGFNDEPLAKLLNLTFPAQAPLITLMIGRRTK